MLGRIVREILTVFRSPHAVFVRATDMIAARWGYVSGPVPLASGVVGLEILLRQRRSVGSRARVYHGVGGGSHHGRRLRLLYLAAYDISRPVTGTAARGEQCLKFFADRYEVHVIYFDGDRASRGQTSVAPRIPRGVASAAGVPYTQQGYFLFSRRFYRQAKQLCAERRFDVIFSDFDKAGLYGGLLAKRFGIPMVYNTHNVEYRRHTQLIGHDWRRALLVPYTYVVERWACRIAQLVVAITQDDARVFRRWIKPDQVIVSPGGFDEKRFHPFYSVPMNRAPRILFVGNLHYPPNQEAVRLLRTRVIEEVLAQHPQAIFQVVGSCPPDLVGHPRMEFTGFAPDLVPYLRKASVVVVPVLRGGGMRIKTLEALACGKPVVATQKGAEGLCADRIRSLRVVPIKEFPKAIHEALERGVSVTNEDFPVIRSEYSSTAVLERLASHLEGVLSS